MELNIKKSIALVAGAILFTACGGGGSSSSTGKAYYLDSAVAGVSYKCGNQAGVTGDDGSFTFEKGSNCSFYLGDYKFKEISSAKLTNGAKIVEDDTKIAAILQTLDDDGNPENGIHIKKHIAQDSAEVLKKHHSEIHTNIDGVLDDLVVKMHSDNKAEVEYHGHKVDEHTAAEHLNKTKLKVEQEHHSKASGSANAHGKDDHQGDMHGSTSGSANSHDKGVHDKDKHKDSDK